MSEPAATAPLTAESVLTEQDRAIARAMTAHHDQQELGKRYSEHSRVVSEALRILHEDYRMSLRAIGALIGCSGPRVHEIINGPRPKRKPGKELR